MQTDIVLTVIGPDRPGLVSALAQTVADGGGNWLDARMASLAGQFAGILLVGVEAEKADALVDALKALEKRGLRFIFETNNTAVAHEAARTLTLELVGLDRPGIVRDISRVVAAQQISIVDLETELVSGSFSGEAMFKARAVLTVPETADIGALRTSLEALANELMVDLSFDG